MLNEKAMIIYLIAALMKKILYKMSLYFTKPYGSFGGDMLKLIYLITQQKQI